MTPIVSVTHLRMTVGIERTNRKNVYIMVTTASHARLARVLTTLWIEGCMERELIDSGSVKGAVYSRGN